MPALSAHFTEEELRGGGAPVNVRSNLARLAIEVLEPLRAVLGVPLRITSGYRDPARNTAVAGSETSQHLDGTAADVSPVGMSLYEAAQRITARYPTIDARPWGQLIYYPYTSGHIHVSLPSRSKRGETLVKLGGETGGYANFSLATFPRWQRKRKRGTST